MTLAGTKTLTGAKILVETLKNIGVECVFGYPGGVVLAVYDELSKTQGIKHYLMRHEQGAVHAAEGYARVSDKCGVVLVTSGPGATNTVTGIANAYLDGYPLLVISGQVNRKLIGKNAFQEVDFLSITKSCTKAVYQINDIDELETTIQKAHQTAISGKKGPVVIDIPKDIFYENTDFLNKSFNAGPLIAEKNYNTENVIKELFNAKTPLILSGGGVLHSKTSDILRQLSNKTNIPIVTTMMGIGTISRCDKNYAGMIGLYGDSCANEIFKNADVILALGVRLNDRITSVFDYEIFKNKKIIQIDINKDELSKNLKSYMNIHSDLKSFLDDLLKKMSAANIPNYKDWKNRVEILKSNKPQNKKLSDKLHAFEVIQTLNEYLRDKDCTIATEVGQHQICVVKNFEFDKSRKLITSGGLGAMGFGFPAAIGASIAHEGKPVVCITGDGSFQMNMQELAVCAEYKLPVKIFIINNGYLGLVRQLQEKQCQKRYFETEILNPDFVKIAESYGISGFQVTKNSDLLLSIKKAFEINAPVIIDFLTEPMENV